MHAVSISGRNSNRIEVWKMKTWREPSPSGQGILAGDRMWRGPSFQERRHPPGRSLLHPQEVSWPSPVPAPRHQYSWANDVTQAQSDTITPISVSPASFWGLLSRHAFRIRAHPYIGAWQKKHTPPWLALVCSSDREPSAKYLKDPVWPGPKNAFHVLLVSPPSLFKFLIDTFKTFSLTLI